MKLFAAFACLLVVALAEDFDIDSRIVNGQMAEIYDHPYMVSLQKYTDTNGWRHICGAVILSNLKVVTAAHCLDGQDINLLRIKVGHMNLSAPANNYEQTHSIASVIIHQQYNGNGNGVPNDIGLIRPSTAIVFNKNVQPAELAPAGSSFANSECLIIGWGRKVNGGPVADHLKKAYITKITKSACSNQWIWYGQIITDNHICVFQSSDPAGTRPSACNGDSGGPMMCGPTKNLLAGITSWGVATCSGDMPSVYTRVSAYITWILAN